MMRRRDAFFALCAVAVIAGASVAWPARAKTTPPVELAQHLQNGQVQGQGRLRYFGLAIYDIRLWSGEAPVTAANWTQQPLALELIYLRSLVGQAIAERSLKEMQALDVVAPDVGARWLEDMKRAFPDVKAGDRITGVQLPGQAARFYVNGKLSAEVRDAGFTRSFFGIWLHPKSSQPALRKTLLGGA